MILSPAQSDTFFFDFIKMMYHIENNKGRGKEAGAQRRQLSATPRAGRTTIRSDR